jgi:hypothetical protein
MQEIVSPAQAEAIVRGAALAFAGAGLIGVIAALARRGARLRARMVLGALVIAAGGLVYFLWLVYNSISARLGLDSVKGLLINLAIFVAVGLVYGIGAGLAWRRANSAAKSPE